MLAADETMSSDVDPALREIKSDDDSSQSSLSWLSSEESRAVSPIDSKRSLEFEAESAKGRAGARAAVAENTGPDSSAISFQASAGGQSKAGKVDVVMDSAIMKHDTQDEQESFTQASIALVQQVTKTTEAESISLLRQARGDVSEAIYRQLDLQRTKVPRLDGGSCGGAQDDPSTILYKALKNAKTSKCLQDGDVLVILDFNEPLTVCRVRAQSLHNTSLSKLMLPPLHGPIGGIKHLLVLRHSVKGQTIPTLSAAELSVSQAECEASTARAVFRGPSTVLSSQGSMQDSSAPLKKEEAASQPWSIQQKQLDWSNVHESFFRIISHTETKHCLIDLDNLDHIEGVAHLVNHYNAHKGARTLFTAILAELDEEGLLWEAVVKDPVCWLRIAENIQHSGVFKEALTHVVGDYDRLRDGGLLQGLSRRIMTTVNAKAASARELMVFIDRELSLLTVLVKDKKNVERMICPSEDMATNSQYLLVHSFVDDWLKEHLRAFGAPSIAGQRSVFCKHTDACLTTTTFYRMLGRGGDAYFTEKDAFRAVEESSGKLDAESKDVIRDCLKQLKITVAELVKPLVSSNLRYQRKSELPYLTFSAVQEQDCIWLGHVKQEDRDEDEA